MTFNVSYLTNPLISNLLRYFDALMGFACLVYTINAIELMLVWNEITDTNHVDSIGQLFPLVVGAFTLVELLLKNLPGVSTSILVTLVVL